MKGQPWLWLVVLILSLPQIGWGQKNYTCAPVRVDPKTGRMVGWGGYYGFWERVKTKEEARQQLFGLQRWAQERSLKLGMENTAQFLDNAFYWLEKRGLLDCETKLEVIRRDLEFYNQHPDLLLGTYPWSVAGLPCARNWLKKELQRKDVSRLYHAWLIVEASRVWYEPYRDSLFSVIRDTSLPVDFRVHALDAIRFPKNMGSSDPEYHFAIEILQDTTAKWQDWLFQQVGRPLSHYFRVDRLKKQGRLQIRVDTLRKGFIWGSPAQTVYRVKHYPLAERMFELLRMRGYEKLIPDSLREKVDIINPEPYRDEKGGIIQFWVEKNLEIFYDAKDTIEIGNTSEAWFYYWRPWIESWCGIQQNPWVMGFDWNSPIPPGRGAHALGYYYSPENRFYLTPYTYTQIDYFNENSFVSWRSISAAIAVCRHENMHRIVDVYYWGDAYSPERDKDHDLLPDDWEIAGITVGEDQYMPYTVHYDTAQTATHTFYGTPYPDGEHVALLNACAWPYEGKFWKDEDWSWGAYSAHFLEVIPDEDPPTDGKVKIVFPLRWVMGENRVKVPGEIKAVGVLEGGREGKIKWELVLGNRIWSAYTESGDTVRFRVGKYDLPAPGPSQTTVFGRKTLRAEWVPPLCLLAHTPEQGEQGVPVTSPVVLAFSHPMDTASVRQGLSISPNFPKTFTLMEAEGVYNSILNA